MDANHPSLLDKLIDSPAEVDETKVDFKTVLQRMEVESVFDIVRMSKEQFTLELALHSNADAELVYTNAQSYARQISRLYQEQQLSAADAPGRTRRSLGADSQSLTYQTLFNENWEQFCKDGDIAAIDSPVAYLRALYLFAQQLEKASTRSNKITLEKRRPDIKELKLDHHNAFAARPMLSVVNDTLSHHIHKYLKETNSTKSVYEVLASKHFPLSLPYDFHHQQCLLGLGADKPALGELNYRVSLKLPLSDKTLEYGSIKKPSSEAQKLLSGLSPEQQRILIAPPDPNVVVNAYGASGQVSEAKPFKTLTGLTTDQIDQMLSLRKHYPKESTNPLGSERHYYGCFYVNGHLERNLLRFSYGELDWSRQPKTELIDKVLYNFTDKHLDRTLRMVRLQRWTGISFAELDTLIINALNSEGAESVVFNTNTLRVLGVYQYLKQRHGILPEEFASLLDNMPTHACDDRIPLFDQVFNRTQLLTNPLAQKKGQDLDVEATESQPTLNYLGAGLGLTVTQDSLLLLAKQTKKYRSSLKHDLPTVSSLYRQARIARMFGLSPMECTELARLLGGDTFCKLLATGTLRTPDTSTTDLLDVLMALDWAVEWLRKSKRDVAQLCRLLKAKNVGLSMEPDLQNRLNALKKNIEPSLEQKISLIESLLHDIADVSAEYLRSVMILAGSNVEKVYDTLKAHTEATMPVLLAKVLHAAEVCRGLHLNSDTLNALLNQPNLLASDNSRTLTLQTLYLLECVSHCTRRLQAPTENALLHYLSQATTADKDKATHSKNCNDQLAHLLNWTAEEVSCLTAQLPSGHGYAISMEEVDWVMRCQACCESTGLPARILLKATDLTADSGTSDWKAVGEAVIAACH